MEDIILLYAEACGITFEEITGPTRVFRLSVARQLIWKKLRECGMPYESIALLFGRKSHSSVVHGVQRIEDLLQTGDQTAVLFREKMAAAERV